MLRSTRLLALFQSDNADMGALGEAAGFALNRVMFEHAGIAPEPCIR
jgi:hypothetical protein